MLISSLSIDSETVKSVYDCFRLFPKGALLAAYKLGKKNYRDPALLILNLRTRVARQVCEQVPGADSLVGIDYCQNQEAYTVVLLSVSCAYLRDIEELAPRAKDILSLASYPGFTWCVTISHEEELYSQVYIW